MATTKTPEASKRTHRALLPTLPRRDQSSQVGDKTQALWPWYLVPFNEPNVSPECRAMVMGEYEPEDEDEKQILLSELANAGMVRGDAATAIVQAPGACSAVRQDYAAKGMRLISPITGEASGGPALQIFEPRTESGHTVGRVLTDPYIGIKDVITDLEVRKRWALAQLDAKIALATEMMRDTDGETKRYYRNIVSALRSTRNRVDNGLPTIQELQLHFKRYELQRLESQQDRRLREEQVLQGRINDTSRDIARLTDEINGSAVWPPAGAEPVEA